MLKQILADMYIDPDLLAELSEEQKQILFFKMREEQIRRWKEREAALERKEASPGTPRPKKENGKSVHWRLGADQEVWVWVMGEHPLDKPYDVLCNEIVAERARKQAEQDAQQLRKVPLEASPPNTGGIKSQRCDRPDSGNREASTVPRKAVRQEGPAQESRSTPLATEDEKTQSSSSSTRTIQQMLADSISRMKACGFQQKKEPVKKQEDEEVKEVDEERTKQIYKNWKEDSEWQASLRKSKLADEKRRSLARQAREDYKRLSQRSRSGQAPQSPASVPQKPKRPPLPPKPQFLSPAKPLRTPGVTRMASSFAQEDIIRWFKEEQLPFRAGYLKTSDTVAPWFHGILTLQKANELLSSTGVPGTFLVRVSEKIKGYALSYLAEDGSCKHFLIDASADSYSFLGVDQLQHATLADLVEYHKEEPITSLGRERLLYPCGQQDQPPDYQELFE